MGMVHSRLGDQLSLWLGRGLPVKKNGVCWLQLQGSSSEGKATSEANGRGGGGGRPREASVQRSSFKIHQIRKICLPC